MTFKEKIKKEVRQKAAYQCCRCRSIGVEVHHILPQERGGSDDIDNAAPLCPNCHTDFGDNLLKRKAIAEMRDWWYERVEKMYGGKSGDLELLREINEKVEEIQKNQAGVSELKALLKVFANQSIDKLTSETAAVEASGVVSATTLGDKVHANFHCKNCKTLIGLLIGSNNCPNCGAPIN